MTFPFPRVAASPHRRVAFLLLLALIASALWAGRAPILRGIANLWIVADAPRKADAIVILGGGIEIRPKAAAQLYRAGWASKILILQPRLIISSNPRVIIDEGADTRKILLEEDVPGDAIEIIGHDVINTYDEARAIASWAKMTNLRQFIVPTEPLHTRRARWILKRELDRESGGETVMIPVSPPRYLQAHWWNGNEILKALFLEICKFCYYRIRF